MALVEVLDQQLKVLEDNLNRYIRLLGQFKGCPTVPQTTQEVPQKRRKRKRKRKRKKPKTIRFVQGPKGRKGRVTLRKKLYKR